MHAEESLAMEHDMRSTPLARMQQKRRYSGREHHYITPSEGAAHCCARYSARTRGTSMTFTTGPPNGTVTAGRRRRLSRCVLALQKGETTFVTSSLPAASPGSTSVATGAVAADCRLGLAGAGRAAEASETVVASIRSGGRSSGAAAGTLAAVLLFRVAICWLTSVVTDLWWALLIYIYIYIYFAAYIFW